MARPQLQPGEPKTRKAIITLLKTEGAMDSSALASKLGLTAMGVRQHLYALQNERLVHAKERPGGVGRPAKVWQLTREADRLFPDAYAELSVAIINAVGDAFGQEGLLRVLESRSHKQRSEYSAQMASCNSLEDRVRALARIRTSEGYMADVSLGEDGQLLFVERHCPICAAATACTGFCSAELDLFQTVLGPAVQVERVEHIIAGDVRCAYRISPR